MISKYFALDDLAIESFSSKRYAVDKRIRIGKRRVILLIVKYIDYRIRYRLDKSFSYRSLSTTYSL